MTKEYNITSDKEEFFRKYVELIKPFLRGISGREADVFSSLLYHNYLKRDIINKVDRFKIIFDMDTRKTIEKDLGISTATFRNALSGLRQKKLIKLDGTIHDTYLIIPTDEEIALKFNFKLKV